MTLRKMREMPIWVAIWIYFWFFGGQFKMIQKQYYIKDNNLKHILFFQKFENLYISFIPSML